MARIKIVLPEKFQFSTQIPVRITDLNFAGHVGNDTILSILHEIRIQFLAHYGYTELDLAGAGTIMNDVSIEYKNEIFYGDTIIATVAVANFSRVSFEVYYKLEKTNAEGKIIPIVFAKTGHVTYDYQLKKIIHVPEAARIKMTT